MLLKKLETKSLSSYEQFCVPADVDRVPARFLTMLSILRGAETHSEEEKRSLLAAAIRDRMKEYITLSISDRTRSRSERRES